MEMKATKKKKVLLVSCTVIMLCICIIAGMSYALFTDSVSVGNHLQAGNLKVTLKRTNLEYAVLNDEGILETTTVEGELDLTDYTDENVFGLDSDDMLIAPGSYFDAELEIANTGNTAFNYSVSVKLNGTATELAKQLKVTVYDANGTAIGEPAMLSDLASGLSISAGIMKVTDDAQKFRVRVEFVNDNDYNTALENSTEDDLMDNDLAQSGSAAFDLVVTAEQTTATPISGS